MKAGDTALADALFREFTTTQATSPPAQLLAGRFTLRRRLGEGGFGIVYAADDSRNGGQVALKLVRSADGSWLYRFKREFRTLQGLCHPGLVSLGELFSDGGIWFFTMELIDGINFVEYVREPHE